MKDLILDSVFLFNNHIAEYFAMVIYIYIARTQEVSEYLVSLLVPAKEKSFKVLKIFIYFLF